MNGRTIGSATPLGLHRATLGECPVWDEAGDSLRWLDIDRAQFLTTDIRTGNTAAIPLSHRPGAIVPNTGGGFVCAAEQGLFQLTADGLGRRIVKLPPGDPGRLNDGKCDARGRFWVGTAVRTGQPAGALYKFEGDRADLVVPGVGMSNGIGWSPDNSILYYVDTAHGQLDAFDFDLARGEVSKRRTLLKLEKPTLPDGLTVDSEGTIWLALWGGGRVLRILPSGDIDGHVGVPVAFVTSCTFGGDDNATLFITTAAGGGLPGDQGGAVFSIALDVAGQSQNAFGQPPPDIGEPGETVDARR